MSKPRCIHVSMRGVPLLKAVVAGWLAIGVGGSRASAAVTTWLNTGSAWSTAGNWSGGAPASTNTDATLPAAVSRVNPVLAANTASFGVLTLDNSLGNYDITGSWLIQASEIAVTGGGATTISGTIALPQGAVAKLTAGTAQLRLNKWTTYTGTGSFTIQTSSSGSGSVGLMGGVQIGSASASAARTMNLSGSGTVLLGNVISGTNAASTLVTTSFSGKLEVSGINAVFGGWDHNSGTLIMNGVSTATAGSVVNGVTTGIAGPIPVGPGTVLGGTGTVNQLTLERRGTAPGAGGYLKPGDQLTGAAVGRFTVNGDLTLQCGTASVTGSPTPAQKAASAGTMELDLNSTNNYDQVIANGAVELKGASTASGNGRLSLNISTDFQYPSETPVFLKLIDKQSAGAIANTFWNTNAANIPEGATFSFVNALSQTNTFQYTYVGGDGNDFGVIVTGHALAPRGAIYSIR